MLNQSSSTFGDGWTLQGLEQITSASGGVILSLGGGSTSLWFSGSPGVGGNYTSPGGGILDADQDLQRLHAHPDGWDPDHLQLQRIRDSDNRPQRSAHDLSRTTATISSRSVEDPYAGLTTFTLRLRRRLLQTIEDPAVRLTTFTHSGSDLTGRSAGGRDARHLHLRLRRPDDPGPGPAWQPGDRQLRRRRAGWHHHQPDSATQEFSSYQEQGWTNSGTSGSPAAATLLAESASNYTDPNSNLTQLRPDWYGLGTTGQTTDALGDVTTYDVNSNGLADRQHRPARPDHSVHLQLAREHDRGDLPRRNQRSIYV